MELFFVHEFAWSNWASTKIDDDLKTQIISKCLHDFYFFKNKECISRSRSSSSTNLNGMTNSLSYSWCASSFLTVHYKWNYKFITKPHITCINLSKVNLLKSKALIFFSNSFPLVQYKDETSITEKNYWENKGNNNKTEVLVKCSCCSHFFTIQKK